MQTPDTAVITIRPADGPGDLAAVRALCWDYRAHLRSISTSEAELVATFYPEAKYHALMDTLESVHARPTGTILVAELHGNVVGCGMSHALDERTSEIKRLFVAPHGRGHGAAKGLMTALLQQARTDGFARVVLDTSRSLTAARALYTSLGMAERGPYQDIPDNALAQLLFFEATL